MHSISHIEYKKKCKEEIRKRTTLFYKVEMNRIRVEDFSDENDNSCSRQMLKDNDLISIFLIRHYLRNIWNKMKIEEYSLVKSILIITKKS